MIYRNEKLKEISFPLGGIGTGCINLKGNGVLSDFEIYNRPNQKKDHGYTFLAIKAEYPDGTHKIKMLQGDCTENLSGEGNQFGYGPASTTVVGFPHFKKLTFDGKFPIAKLTLEDGDFPAKIVLEAFNPFIPHNSDDSGIPAAFFNIKVRSKVDGVKYTVYFTLENRFDASLNKKNKSGKYTAITLESANVPKNSSKYGDLTIATDGKECECQEYWYRGWWLDKMSSFWHELNAGKLKNRTYDTPGKCDVATIGSSAVIDSNKTSDFRFVLTWNVPNYYSYWHPYTDKDGNEITWKNYYATIFKDSLASAKYSLRHFNTLYKKTKQFTKSLHSATLDPAIIDAASSTISVLKSPTVLRLENGALWGWEGTHINEGSCYGTCTHVWSYAYALCFLFPDLERSIRDTELKYDTLDNGGMHFRTLIPLGREEIRQFLPCVDGQMATIFKIYRDWKITGNTEWLKNNWEKIKSILEFAWSDTNAFEWDRDKDGVLEGRQHHTLDMELFGPSSWLEGMYLCALKAASEMAKYLDDTEKAREYSEIFDMGYKWTKDNLFNGEYFIHKVDLANTEYTEHFDCPQYWNDEKSQLKYQIQNGSIIDQMLGQWHSNVIGLGDIFDKEQRKTALKNMFKNNFKTNMRDFANMWRVFAINDEAGTVMCDYPAGTEKPVIPIPYCEECMTGFEYSFAGLLISEGFIDEGLTVIKAIRDRYDGKKRNPWNEIECGSNYARPMSSFALLPIFSGYTFDAPNNSIGFAPLLDGDFKCFFSFENAWGDYIRTSKSHTLSLHSGTVTLKKITLDITKPITRVIADGKEISFSQNGNELFINTTKITNKLIIEV